ncbi:hypothetical protein [Marinifilum sp.]|uniref:hypothetical protein n=1 Tax=Marinifilum sp. TaxID=2033137 RepID=UPI003BAB346F
MNITTKLLLVSTFLLPIHLPAQTMMFSANPLKKNELCAFVRFQHFETKEKYNWNLNEWQDLTADKETVKSMYLPMIGYGINHKLSAFAQFPIYRQIQNHISDSYFNEILLMSRYALIPASGKKSGISLIGAFRFPTESAAHNPFADGSIDIILGEIFSTKWYGKWRTHIKSEYAITTKNDAKINPGDEFKVLLKQGYKWWNIQLYGITKYIRKFKSRNLDDSKVDHSQSYKLVHLLGADWKIYKNFIFKSRIEIPSIAKGGSNYHQKFSCDLVYYI